LIIAILIARVTRGRRQLDASGGGAVDLDRLDMWIRGGLIDQVAASFERFRSVPRAPPRLLGLSAT